MGLKFNPFSGTFDFAGASDAAPFAGQVDAYADLPLDSSAALNSRWLVKNNSGTWPFSTYRQAGIYIRVNTVGASRDTDYQFVGTLPSVMNDNEFLIYDDADATKNLKFQLSGITTGTTRTLTAPNANGTIARTEDFAAPPAIGNTTRNTVAATTISATGAITGAEASSTSVRSLANGLQLPVASSSGAVGILSSFTAGNNELRIYSANSGGTISNIATFNAGSGVVATSIQNTPIGSTTPNTGAFTTLTLKDSTGGETATFDAQNKLTANRTYDLPNASGTLALTSDIPSGGSKTYAVFTAEHNQPPATAFATLDTRNSIAVLDFDDATDESAVFVSIIPEGASLGSGLKIRLHWMATTATSGNVVWDVSLERMTTDLDSDSFDTIASGTAAANGTSGILTVTEITLTTIDSVTAGDGFRLKVTRDANNASDTMTGDAELVVCEVRSAA